MQNQAAAGGLFGDDDEEENGQAEPNQQQLQQYQDDLGLDDDILGLDDGAGEVPADHEGALLMRFCPHDSSMLYPKVSLQKCSCDVSGTRYSLQRGHTLTHIDHNVMPLQENRSEQKLLYACRLCRYTEYAQGQMIYKNVLKKEVGNVLHTVPSAVSDDPTLPRSQNAHCGKCGHNEAVFFQSDTSDVRNDTLALIFVCCNCDYKWVA